MIKRLVKHGNSHALIIDQAILELLRIEPEDPLELSTDGRMLVVSPVEDVEKRERLTKSLKKINRKHGSLLKKLAE